MRLPRLRPVLLVLLALVVLAALPPAASAQRLAFLARLDGDQMVPPVPTSARAIASVVVDLSTRTLHFDLTHVGLGASEVSAAIHGFAPAGSSAGPLFQLPLGYKKTGTWSFAAGDAPQILAQLAYIQIATTAFPGGELRGQLLRDPSSVVMKASLDGDQGTPPNPTLARGTAHCSIETGANTLAYFLAFEGITSPQTAIHIHGPALPGLEGPPVFALPVNAGNFLSGTWTYDEIYEADILAGLMYWNVHSNAVPGGEIRGQLDPATSNPVSYCTAKVTSLGCTPALSWSGVLAAPASFQIHTSQVNAQTLGVYFYGLGGALAQPFQGGFLCVQPPITRTAPQGSGGSAGTCTGAFTFAFGAHVASGLDPALVPGALVNVQTWFRDPGDPVGTGLSDALMLEIQ